MTLDKKQAADALYISLRTLERRMKAGVYKFTRTGEGQWAEVSFTYADLGLSEPTPAPKYNDFGKEFDQPTPVSEPAKPTLKMREPSPLETKQAKDLAFAERYRMGEATDSYGNDVNGSNKLCPTAGPQCGVKARDVEQGPPADSQAHMNPINIARSGEYACANDNPLNRGLSDTEMSAAMENWRKTTGGAPSDGQVAMEMRSKAIMHSAFARARGNATTASGGLAQ